MIDTYLETLDVIPPENMQSSGLTPEFDPKVFNYAIVVEQEASFVRIEMNDMNTVNNISTSYQPPPQPGINETLIPIQSDVKKELEEQDVAEVILRFLCFNVTDTKAFCVIFSLIKDRCYLHR